MRLSTIPTGAGASIGRSIPTGGAVSIGASKSRIGFAADLGRAAGLVLLFLAGVWVGGSVGVLAVAGFAGSSVAQTVGAAGPLGVVEAEDLVRRLDYEGMAEDEGARIGPDGVARLVEMLADPAERPHQARILLALGSCGGPAALDAMRAWLEALPAAGELDRATFRAWQNLPFALGRLARREPRAVDALVERFEASAPGWSFRHFRGERLRQLEQRGAATALGTSRRPEAARALDRLARQAHPPALADHLRAVRAELGAAEPGVVP